MGNAAVSFEKQKYDALSTCEWFSAIEKSNRQHQYESNTNSMREE